MLDFDEPLVLSSFSLGEPVAGPSSIVASSIVASSETASRMVAHVMPASPASDGVADLVMPASPASDDEEVPAPLPSGSSGSRVQHIMCK